MRFDAVTSGLATVLRGGAGSVAGRLGPRPSTPIDLYEFEACPFCRKVREAITALDLTVRIFPCPRGGKRYRPEVERRGGKRQFPFMVDPNTGRQMYESDEINRHLYDRYGAGAVPLTLRLGPVTTVSAAVPSLVRPNRAARPSRLPEQPLELWGFEASPYCRIVREVLCELELPYVLNSVGHGSPRRAELIRIAGRMMVPYLVDPNTKTGMFESADIVEYIRSTYAE